VLEQTRALGIKNILALRGDPPDGGSEFVKTAGGFEYSWQLVERIREFGGFSIGVAGFPEGHIACREGKLVDWERLKAKIGYGADFVISQLFFDKQPLLRVSAIASLPLGVNRADRAGHHCRSSPRRRSSASSRCAAPICRGPLLAELERHGDDDEAVSQFGIEYATRQCEELLREGCAGTALLHAQQSAIDDGRGEEPGARTVAWRRECDVAVSWRAPARRRPRATIPRDSGRPSETPWPRHGRPERIGAAFA